LRNDIQRALALDLLQPQLGIIVGSGDGGSVIDIHRSKLRLVNSTECNL